MDSTVKFVEVEPLNEKKKTWKAVAKFLYQYRLCDIHITDQGRELVNSISEEFLPYYRYVPTV